MAMLDYAKNPKPGFFSIYKPGQGKYLRWGTVAGAALFIVCGAYWIGQLVRQRMEIPAVATAVVIWTAVWSFALFILVNTPKFAEFLIMTESEMRKVTWPTRREVINSTKIVILLTLILAFLLWMVDFGFLELFTALKIL
jgi:preprotein translocase subunit SecE